MTNRMRIAGLSLRQHFAICLVVLVATQINSSTISAGETEFSPEQIEFFEKHVRPLLIERCFECHSSDAEEVEAGLLVESRSAMLDGGDNGPVIVPGDASKSMLIQSVRYETLEMPPDSKLSNEEIRSLEKWVEMGAPWPDDELKPTSEQMSAETEINWPEARASHWAFRPLSNAAPPIVQNNPWPMNEVDQFVLTRLQRDKLAPASPANRRVLVRRAYYDLIGMPPKPEQVNAFLNDKRPDAFAQLVDTLLDSPHYGERWGRYWLDVARYSDGFGGFLDNKGLPHAWRYRDWVVNALNRDLPYNDFLRMQVAGDLLDPENAMVATGFFALGPTYISDGGDPQAKAQATSETLDDRVDTLSRGILGLTVSCARCHEHKFDPIPQLDYYSLAGVFQNTSVVEKPIAPQEEIEAFQKYQNEIKSKETAFREFEKSLKKDGRKPTDEEQNQINARRQELDTFKRDSPPPLDSVHALQDRGSNDMKLAIRGNLLRQGPIAPRRFLRVLAGANPDNYVQGSGRLELAESLSTVAAPLASRVIVNRIWMHHFGQGLVRTPSNFGTLGEKPTHPELLDWLAKSLIDSKWSMKQLHRRIMLSATYQMSSDFDEFAFQADGGNRLLWRMSPRRLDVEAWRDTLLAVSGELELQLGGPPSDRIDNRRRTLYLKSSRNGDVFQTDQLLRLFDFPQMRATVAQRPTSIVPQQFLFLMNSPFMEQRAKALTVQLATAKETDSERVQLAYETLYQRPATSEEIEVGIEFLNSPKNQQQRLSAWDQYAQVLLSANELMYVR
ncbi:DUF1549 domain-containing protein [Rhodopirellula sp.]|nr:MULTISPECIES: DUF1549 domain-containing protein [Pirellulaceae]MDB4338755.1 DUF1549 domain-containing protein [Rubripirellula sp.]MDB4678916.1 DUF1549 domain-containing protein [Rhodopirellula sp.]